MLKKNFFFNILIFGLLLLSQAGIAQERETNPFDIGTKPVPVQTTNKAAPQNIDPDSQNPFDINKKPATNGIDNSGTATISNTDATVPVSTSDNPFDIKASTAPLAKTNKTIQPLTPKAAPSIAIITKAADPTTSQNFLFILTFSTLLILTVFVTLSRDLIRKIYNALFNETSLKALHRDKGSINVLMYNLLYAMFVINLGIFVFLCVRQYFLIGGSQWVTLLSCATAIGLIVAAKHSVLNAMMVVFPIYKELNLYNFIIMIFGIMMGCILAPMNVVLAYASPETAKQFAIGIAAILFVFFLLRYLRSILVTTKFVTTNILHYVLYIMAFEIAPVAIMLKLFLLKFAQSV